MTFVTQPFRGIAATRSKSLGLPSLPILLIDHPLANRTPDEIDAIVDLLDAAIGDTIAALPLAA